PLWVIPAGADHWADTPAAAALAIGAAMVPLPAPADDRGATAHLLGNARFYQLIHPAAARIPDAPPDLPPLPFVAVFQADQFSVAAIAGPGAGTPLDRAYPTLAAGKTVIIPASDPDQDDPPYANLRLPDDAAALRAVDAAGAPIDCRVGDYLYVPAAEKLVYVLAGGAGGNAEELAALLRPATANRLPAFDFSLAIPPDIAHTGEGGLTLRLTNISPNPLPGTLRLFRMPPATTQPAASQLAAPPKPELLTSRPFDTLPPGKTLNTFLDAGPSIRPGQTLLLEITTPTLTQRTALILH
ncbi:MAG TPA: hypothetical protein VHQ47_08070, partial [Phycisphaerae bacterium]|nr:hypothetical protein [Phycisphaerae bacterium]